MKRSRMSRKASKRSFRSGTKVERRNVAPSPQRGGWRL